MTGRDFLKRATLLTLLVGIVASCSFLLGAIAQRTCWPRFCTQFYEVAVDSVIDTNHARIETRSVTLPFFHDYGALEILDSAYVVASGTGELFHVGDDHEITRLPFSIPLRDDEFRRDNGAEGIQPNSFSVKDILVRRRADRDVEILATYHVWFPEQKCFTLRMSSAIADADLKNLRREWETVFDAAPCSAVKTSGVRFAGTGAGGRMVRFSDAEVLLTVGDHEYDGAVGSPAQDPASSFGKTILVNAITGAARIYSAGHRNPQGLVKARDGRIWSTEHGPKGGDELNLVQDGQNYGWPFATHGAQYNAYAWPLDASAPEHSAFVGPVHAWVPSVGISQLIQIEGRKFSRWSGDLLAASLRGTSLFRLRVEGERVAFSEPIPVKARVRDLIEHPDGTIALLSYDRLILLQPTPEGGPAPTGSAAPPVSRPSGMSRLLDAGWTLLKDLAGQ